MINDPQLKAALSGDYDFCHLVTIGFTGGNLYVTDSDVDEVHNGTIYLAGLFQKMGNIKSATGIKINDLKLEFNGLAPSVIALGLNDQWMNRKVTLQKLIKTRDYAGTLHIFNGLLSGMQINGTTLNFNASSIWKDFEKTNGRKTNSESHRRIFPTTAPFKFTATITDSVAWGKKGSN